MSVWITHNKKLWASLQTVTTGASRAQQGISCIMYNRAQQRHNRKATRVSHPSRANQYKISVFYIQNFTAYPPYSLASCHLWFYHRWRSCGVLFFVSSIMAKCKQLCSFHLTLDCICIWLHSHLCFTFSTISWHLNMQTSICWGRRHTWYECAIFEFTLLFTCVQLTDWFSLFNLLALLQ